MNPISTGSSNEIMTIGIVVVARCAARIKGSLSAMRTSTGSRTNSAVRSAPYLRAKWAS
jgi:hypothetical protein